MKTGRKEWRLWFALVAALLFLMQSVASGVALASTGVPLDAFGNPLCLGDGHNLSKKSGGHEAPPDCCSLACMAGATPGTLPEDVSLALRGAFGQGTVQVSVRAFFIVADDHDPGSPRAPPAMS